MSPIYRQLSDKPLLAFVYSHGVRDMKHNRDEKLNAEHLLAVQRAAGLRPPCRLNSCRLNYTAPDIPYFPFRETRFIRCSQHQRRMNLSHCVNRWWRNDANGMVPAALLPHQQTKLAWGA